MAKRRVLIVDDNTDLAETVAGILTDEGFEVAVVATGAQALIAWRARPAELVLVDVDLPDIGGIRLARRLASRGGCGLLVMSAHDAQAMASTCKELGVVFLAKPFTPSRLLAAIRVTREKHRAAEATRRRASSPRLLGSREPKGLLR